MNKKLPSVFILLSLHSAYGSDSAPEIRDNDSLNIKSTSLLNTELASVVPSNTLIVTAISTTSGPNAELTWGAFPGLEARLSTQLNGVYDLASGNDISGTLKFRLTPESWNLGIALLGNYTRLILNSPTLTDNYSSVLALSYFFEKGVLSVAPRITWNSSSKQVTGADYGLAFRFILPQLAWVFEGSVNSTANSPVTTTGTFCMAYHFDTKNAVFMNFLSKNEDNSLSAGLLYISFTHGIGF